MRTKSVAFEVVFGMREIMVSQDRERMVGYSEVISKHPSPGLESTIYPG
jgi:hypothetical protein